MTEQVVPLSTLWFEYRIPEGIEKGIGNGDPWVEILEYPSQRCKKSTVIKKCLLQTKKRIREMSLKV